MSTLENLNITITQESSQAVQGLTALENALTSLQAKANSFNLKNVSSQINSLKNQARKITNTINQSTKGVKSSVSAPTQPISAPTQPTDTGANKPDFDVGNINKANSAYSGVMGTFKGLRSTGMLLRATLFGITGAMALTVGKATDYIEQMNLFNVSMGKYAQEAYNYGLKVQDVVGIDLGEWASNQGKLMNMATGFGMSEDKAYKLSQTLNQLSYDLASFHNIDFDTAMTKVRSAIAGQTRPLRELGISVDQANLKQIALRHGISESVTEMSQADKAILRTYAMLEGGKNALGDMARTIYQPANAMRVLGQLASQAGRAIGSIFLPIISKILPYLQALVILLRNAATAIAKFFGYKEPSFDTKGISVNLGTAAGNAGNLGKSTGKAAKNLGKAAKKAKELKSYTMGIDKLNVIEPTKDTSTPSSGSGGGGGGSAGGGGGVGGLDVPTYDFLGNASSKAQEIANKIKSLLPLIGLVALGFASWKIAKGIIDFLTNNVIGKALLNTVGLIAEKLGLNVAPIYAMKFGLGECAKIIAPIALAVATVVLRLISAVKNSQYFRDGLKVIGNVISFIVTGFIKVVKWIKDVVKQAGLTGEKMDAVADIITIGIGGALLAINPVAGVIVLAIEGIVLAVKALGALSKNPTFVTAFTKFKEIVGNLLDTFSKTLKPILVDIIQTAVSIGSKLWSIFKKLLTILSPVIKAIGKIFGSAVIVAIGLVVSAVAGFCKALEAVLEVVNWILDKVAKAYNWFAKIFGLKTIEVELDDEKAKDKVEVLKNQLDKIHNKKIEIRQKLNETDSKEVKKKYQDKLDELEAREISIKTKLNKEEAKKTSRSVEEVAKDIGNKAKILKSKFLKLRSLKSL